MAGPDTFGIMTVTDAVGNTYGISYSTNGSKYFKLSPSGNIIWFAGFIPGIHFSDLILDHSGNFYAAVNDQANGSVYKFDTSGNEIWIKPTPVPNLWHMAVDGANNLRRAITLRFTS
jgi:hypothetical protein